MMFRLLPAAAMTATALAAMTAGAATVDVYGVVDTGLHYVKADSGDTSVTMDSGISKGSRVGLIGSEDRSVPPFSFLRIQSQAPLRTNHKHQPQSQYRTTFSLRQNAQAPKNTAHSTRLFCRNSPRSDHVLKNCI